jgi:hypothetical protein
MMAHVYSPSIQEAEAKGQIQDQPGVLRKTMSPKKRNPKDFLAHTLNIHLVIHLLTIESLLYAKHLFGYWD